MCVCLDSVLKTALLVVGMAVSITFGSRSSNASARAYVRVPDSPALIQVYVPHVLDGYALWVHSLVRFVAPARRGICNRHRQNLRTCLAFFFFSYRYVSTGYTTRDSEFV